MLTALPAAPVSPLLQACLQLFQALPKDVAPLVWSMAGKSEALQSLLGLLLEVSWGKVCEAPGREGAACPKEQSNAILPGCFPRSLSEGSLQRQPQCLGCPGTLLSCLRGQGGRVKCHLGFQMVFSAVPLPPLQAQVPNKDARLLAGTALSMLLNTAPQPERGASAALALFQLQHRGACSLRTQGQPLAEGTAGTGVFGCQGTADGTAQQWYKPDSAAVSCSRGLGAPVATGHLPQSLWDEPGQLALRAAFGFAIFLLPNAAISRQVGGSCSLGSWHWRSPRSWSQMGWRSLCSPEVC